MKSVLLTTLIMALCCGSVAAQERIYRCGNEYTNTVTAQQASTCKLVSGGNITIVQAHKAPPATASKNSTSPVAGGQRIESADQRSKDSDAKQILEAELKKSETRLAELRTEYNNGEPEKLGPETRNHQKYLDRVAELKASIQRTESDINGIRRELGRFSGSSASVR